jgi:hypothetical protein
MYYGSGFAEYEGEKCGVYNQHCVSSGDRQCAVFDSLFQLKSSVNQADRVSSTRARNGWSNRRLLLLSSPRRSLNSLPSRSDYPLPLSRPPWHPLTILDAYAPDVREKYPEMVARYQEFQSRFIDSGYLAGQTCAFMAAGKALPLRGKYFDVEQDIGKVLEHSHEFAEKGLYDLKVEFAGDLVNTGGMTADTMNQAKESR